MPLVAGEYLSSSEVRKEERQSVIKVETKSRSDGWFWKMLEVTGRFE